MAMPSRAGGIEPEAGSGLLKADASGFVLACHIGALSEPSTPALGEETKCPSGIQGISPFTLQDSPSLPLLFRLNPGHKMKAAEGC